MYRNVSRSYLEFQQFYEIVIQNNPQTIVPALPLARTSAPTDEEDDRLVKIMLQRWFARVCEDPILVHEEELRSFVESDFGYTPTPAARRLIERSGQEHRWVDREVDSIPSLMWYGDGEEREKVKEDEEIEWVANEKFCWC